ncbi:hypothetical protein BGZ94_002927 [Podila epigama]|nr:hypothetical protein BGZ94_002927 [Podila epigama]
MSTRSTLTDQRSKVLMLVFMMWTVIGVGFLGADSNTQVSTCVASDDPVYNLSFKIIVFHVCIIGFYFMPCSTLLLTRVLPSSMAAGMTRTATKPMIDNLGSTPMTEDLFGGDPEEATCAICLGDYRPEEEIRFLPCQHHFHLDCIDQWLKTDKSCPLCKHDIDKPMENTRVSAQRCFGPSNNTNATPGTLTGRSRNDEEAERTGANADSFQVIII